MGLSGRGISILELVRNFNKDSYSSTVCCFDERGILADELEREGVEVIVMHRKPGFDFLLIFKLARIMKEKNIDIVHAHNTGPLFYGSLAAKFLGVPVFIDTIHWPINSETWKKRLRNKLCSYLAGKIVTITEYMKNDFSKRNKIPLGKFETIYYGVDLVKYSAQIDIEKKKKELDITPYNIVLGTIARLAPEKGHKYLFQAIKQNTALYSEIKLILVGDGPLLPELKKLAKDLDIVQNVKFLGYRSDIPEIMPIFDIFILPSVFEPFGLVLLEAMAAGKPIIASNISEIPRIILNGETGILVPPKDILSLSDAMLELIRDSKMRQAMGERGRERVIEKFSLKKTTDDYKRLYLNLLAQKINRKVDRKIRIMHVVLSLNCGGLENLVIRLSNAMDKERFHLSICCLDNKGNLGEMASNLGIDVIVMHRKPGFDFSLILRLAYILRKKRVDIVHTHNPSAHLYGTIAARLALIPIVVNTRHGVGVGERPVGNVLLWRLTNKVIAVSHRVKDKLLKSDILNSDKVITIQNGVDIKEFDSKYVKVRKENFGIEDSAPVVGIVARLSVEKDHKTLLKAFKIVIQKIQNVKLVIVGDGHLKEELEKISRERQLDGKVLFLGYRDNIPSLLKLMDVFVLSSFSEGLSLTLLEAMAMEKPIVAARVGGNPEVVLDGVTGRLVPPNDPTALAEALMEILNNKDMAEKMGKRAKERVSRLFSFERFIRDHEKLYSELITQKSIRRSKKRCS